VAWAGGEWNLVQDVQLDQLELHLIAQEAMLRRHLRCTAQVQFAVHQLVEKHFARWKARHPRVTI
jgi:hypothetical protein